MAKDGPDRRQGDPVRDTSKFVWPFSVVFVRNWAPGPCPLDASCSGVRVSLKIVPKYDLGDHFVAKIHFGWGWRVLWDAVRAVVVIQVGSP